MRVYTKDQLKDGTVIQIRKGKDSKAFTLQTRKSPEEIRKILMDILNKL